MMYQAEESSGAPAMHAPWPPRKSFAVVIGSSHKGIALSTAVWEQHDHACKPDRFAATKAIKGGTIHPAQLQARQGLLMFTSQAKAQLRTYPGSYAATRYNKRKIESLYCLVVGYFRRLERDAGMAVPWPSEPALWGMTKPPAWMKLEYNNSGGLAMQQGSKKGGAQNPTDGLADLLQELITRCVLPGLSRPGAPLYLLPPVPVGSACRLSCLAGPGRLLRVEGASTGAGPGSGWHTAGPVEQARNLRRKMAAKLLAHAVKVDDLSAADQLLVSVYEAMGNASALRVQSMADSLLQQQQEQLAATKQGSLNGQQWKQCLLTHGPTSNDDAALLVGCMLYESRRCTTLNTASRLRAKALQQQQQQQRQQQQQQQDGPNHAPVAHGVAYSDCNKRVVVHAASAVRGGAACIEALGRAWQRNCDVAWLLAVHGSTADMQERIAMYAAWAKKRAEEMPDGEARKEYFNACLVEGIMIGGLQYGDESQDWLSHIIGEFCYAAFEHGNVLFAIDSITEALDALPGVDGAEMFTIGEEYAHRIARAYSESNLPVIDGMLPLSLRIERRPVKHSSARERALSHPIPCIRSPPPPGLVSLPVLPVNMP